MEEAMLMKIKLLHWCLLFLLHLSKRNSALIFFTILTLSNMFNSWATDALENSKITHYFPFAFFYESSVRQQSKSIVWLQCHLASSVLVLAKAPELTCTFSIRVFCCLLDKYKPHLWRRQGNLPKYLICVINSHKHYSFVQIFLLSFEDKWRCPWSICQTIKNLVYVEWLYFYISFSVDVKCSEPYLSKWELGTCNLYLPATAWLLYWAGRQLVRRQVVVRQPAPSLGLEKAAVISCLRVWLVRVSERNAWLDLKHVQWHMFTVFNGPAALFVLIHKTRFL